MQLNHVHLAGPDLPALQAFYETWFGFRVRASHDDITFLVDDGGFLLALDASDEPPAFPGWFHLGFCQDSPEAVRELFARMKAGGVRFTRELTEYDGEATVFFCLDPAGTKIEVSWHKD
jgi:catechol 2,3-dioxygenase-like lactoylglutathione lyase family enzyme